MHEHNRVGVGAAACLQPEPRLPCLMHLFLSSVLLETAS